MSYGNLVAPLIEAVKTLANSIDHLSNTINTLYDNYFSQQQQINDLLMRVGELESK